MLDKAIQENGIIAVYEKVEQPSILSQLLVGAFPILLLLGIFFFFMRQMQGGKGGAMGFGRSKAKMMNELKGKVTFNDVAGIEEAKEEVEEIMLVDLDQLIKTKPEEYKVKVKAVAFEYDDDDKRIELFPAKKLGMPSKDEDEWDMGYRSIVSFKLGNINIWGLTGYILKHFLKVIKK